MATQLTMFLIGTPASISERLLPQTEAIELDPLQVTVSDTALIAYGNSSIGGSTGSNAFSASLP